MTTLFDMTLRLADRLGVLRTSTATGGTTNTTIDTVERTEPDDTFNGGTVWLITDAGGASAAPENEWARVTDFDKATNTITHETMTAAPANGDTYGVSTGRYPLDMLKNAINNELVKHEVIRYDTTSLDIIDDQSEYTLPSGVYANNLMGVYVATEDDLNDNRWTPLKFDVQTAAAGSAHTLVILSLDVSASSNVMLEYKYTHARLYNPTDNIDPAIHPDLILDKAAAHCELLRMRNTGSESKLDIEMMKQYREDARIAEMKHPIRLPARRGKISEAAASPTSVARVEPPASP